jgi:hypothetical protein
MWSQIAEHIFFRAICDQVRRVKQHLDTIETLPVLSMAIERMRLYVFFRLLLIQYTNFDFLHILVPPMSFLRPGIKILAVMITP